uniref:RraA-like protein n=1 Tax=Mycena chlorophos TaxID=658473 RepID=A0ABQ0LH99_MYCCL|nr:predicted protein [Mycena chlorophos]
MSLKRLASFSTTELSDALVKLGVKAFFLPGITQRTAGRICAPAYTVQMVMQSDPAPKLENHFVDEAPQGSVVVIDVPPQAYNAVWGGLMSAGALARGAVGVVINGRCRDLGESRSLGFPVFASGTSTLGNSPFTKPIASNVPLVVNTPNSDFPSVTINPGDLIAADEDGVVCIPKDLVDEVVEQAARGKAIDELCMKDISAGLGVKATFAKYRGT